MGIPKVGEIMEEVMTDNHIPRIMTHTRRMERSLDAKAMSRERHKTQREMVATYALGHIPMQSALK